MGCQEDFPLPSQYWKSQVECRCGIVAGCELLSAVGLLVDAAAVGRRWRIGKLDQSQKNSCRAVLLNSQSLVRTFGRTFDVQPILLRPLDHFPNVPVELLACLFPQYIKEGIPENSDTHRPLQ
jgi:hypothetical protein